MSQTRALLARRAFLRLMGHGFTAAFASAGISSLAGCGGGHSSTPIGSGTPTPGATPTPSPGTTPTPTPGGPLTPEKRAAAIAAVNAQMIVFRDAGNATDQQVVEFLRSRPEFEEAGSVKPGGAWARFTDGELFIVSRNFAEPDPDKNAALRYVPEGVTRAAGQEIPRQDRVHILNALGTAFTPPHEDIRLWMVRHGYQLAPEREATIEALKSIQNDGVFYINSHGDYGKTRDNQQLWALWTADEVSPEKDILYKDLLADGSLIRFSAIHNRAPIQNPFNDAIEGNPETHYAITKRFVEKFQWRFGTNSFVFLNCCWSADYDFGEACINRGASAYMGWTNAANPPQAWRAARFLFDRLLGQLPGSNNEYLEPDGPQRAFDLPAVYGDLKRRGWDKTTTSFGNGDLIYAPNNGDFGLLAPSIQYIETEELAKKLILHGEFGTDPGPGIRYVRIEGTDLNVTKWEPKRIEADLLPEQHGDVWVQVVARKSNVRQLTRWDGAMEYAVTGPGTLKVNATMRYRIRADVGKYRSAPGGPLLDREVQFGSVFDPTATKAHFSYSGEADLVGTDGLHSHYTGWTGEGDIVVSVSSPNEVFFVRGTLNTATRQMRMEILPDSDTLFKARSYVKFNGGILPPYTDALIPQSILLSKDIFDETDSSNVFSLHYLVMTLGEQWTIPAGERNVQSAPPTQILIGFGEGTVKKVPTRLSWQTTLGIKPPRASESRSHSASG